MGKRTPHGRRKKYETGYGAFPGGDPRQFHPDGEDDGTLPEEAEAHRLACAAWDRGDRKAVPSAHTYTGATPIDSATLNGGVILHVTEQRFGLGMYRVRVAVLSRKERLRYWRDAKVRFAEHDFSAEEMREARRDYF